MAVDTFRRYIWLLETIDRLGYAEFETIQSEWNRSSLNPHGEDLPKRTFRNHITAIADQLYIYIEYKSGYGYYISNPEDMHESRIKQWMISTLSTYNFLSDCNDIRDKILFEDVPSSQKHLPQVLRCIRNCCALSFMYQSHFSDAAHINEVEPYCLKLFNRRWYMVGRNTDIDELRTYALERMSDLDETEHAFVIPEQFDGESYFSNQYGITADGKPETIVFKAIPLEAKYLRSLPLHHSQEELETNDKYSIFTVYLNPSWEFKHELLSRADQIEILAPESLRNWMRDTVMKIGDKYKQ